MEEKKDICHKMPQLNNNFCNFLKVLDNRIDISCSKIFKDATLSEKKKKILFREFLRLIFIADNYPF